MMTTMMMTRKPRRPRRRARWLAAASLGLLALPALAVAREAETFGRAEAAKLFRRSCRGCHTLPDVAEPLDRAWLDQVRRTA